MRNVFVQEKGYSSSGSNFWNLANRHQGSRKHITNHTAYKLLGNVDVACALDEAHRREVEIHNNKASRYAKMLHHHINISVLLAAQGLSFRGHDESKASSNRGNFIELLDLLSSYSNDLKVFLHEERITYTSHGPQNELIESIYHEVREEIQRRMVNSRYIAVMMDDTSDSSNVEQSAISVRLVNNCNVEEHMLGLVDASKDTSANGLTKILLDTLSSFNLNSETGAEKLIGQSYDGAAVMSGQFSGVQRQMQDKFPSAYYNHCVAHRMALCASKTAGRIPKVAEFFSTVDKLVTFFRSSPKRTSVLGHCLPKPGDTRWLSRDTTVTAIDVWYETIGTALYEFSTDTTQKAENQANARRLCKQIQEIDFVFLLKLYRKLFDYCTPIIKLMQNPSFDAIQLASMLDDFQQVLQSFDSSQTWADALSMDPSLPHIRTRGGWRGVDQEMNSLESWRQSLQRVAANLTQEFSEQIQWRFENLTKFKWIDLVHPAKFDQRRTATVNDQRALISELKELYPFVVPDTVALEHNLAVLYQNKEISALIRQVVRERDALVAKKKEKRRIAHEEVPSQEERADEIADHEELDSFDFQEIEIEQIKEGVPSLQDLLVIIKQAGLEEALPEAVRVIELAVTTPLTSVHCERIFSRMKRIVSPERSTMKQKRKEMLVFLQVENKTLRFLAGQLSFRDRVVNRFKSYNQRRFERFSKK